MKIKEQIELAKKYLEYAIGEQKMEVKDIIFYSVIAGLFFDKYMGWGTLITLSVFKYLGWLQKVLSVNTHQQRGIESKRR